MLDDISTVVQSVDMPVKCESDYVQVRIPKVMAKKLLKIGKRYHRKSVNLEANIAAGEYILRHEYENDSYNRAA